MTIEHRGRKVSSKGKMLALGAISNLALGREGSIVFIEPEPPQDQVLVFRFGSRGTNGPRQTKYQQLAGFLGAIPKDSAVKGLPQGYAVRGEEINDDPVCKKRGIIWKAP
ncbi:MAG: hypothetical protein H0W89_06705 [Candidatus Levybacteria bacterium]|nr:hypothetical protein [Candidatus Levybacteria bacterium]